MQNAWNKYGEDKFEFIIIYDCVNNESLDDVNQLEVQYIAEYKNKGLSYNIHDGGDGGLFLGKHLSDETKKLIGEKNRINMTGRKHSDTTKKKMSNSQKRRWKQLSESDKQNWGVMISEKASGYQWSDEARNKMKGNKNGAKYTIETVKSIRDLYENKQLSFTEISQLLNIPRGTIYNIATYRRWQNV